MAITSNTRSQVADQQVFVHSNPFGRAVKDFWYSPKPGYIGLGAAALSLVVPGYSLAIGALAGAIMAANLASPRRLPVKMPQSSGAKKDPNSPKAGKTFDYNEARGITCLGVDSETNEQIWEDSDNDRRHHVILATTGSGKTFGLRFHMLMSLTQTTGVIAIDGKGDIELPLDATSLIRRFVREDDLRILNFKQGNRNVYAENGEPRTNTFNPFATGSANYIAEVLKALCSGDDPRAKTGDMWSKRADAMCEIIAKLATYKRDHGNFKIRPGTIADMLELRELCRIYVDSDIPERYKGSLVTYFKTLPDFDLRNAAAFADGEEFKGKILEQHGYVAMQLQPALQVLADQYGTIFDTDTPEIDLKDVVINNRFLLVLLPAMEQSEGTLRNTGKIILAALKGMIAGELGSKYQGRIRDILGERACADPAPFKNFFDECGYYAAIPGIEILPAQGRGLGFAFYFIGQTYTDLRKGGDETAQIIWGNCNNKTIGKTEGEETYNKVSERLGEVTVMVRESMEIRTGDFMTERVNTDRLSFVRRKRLEISDLTSLREGQYMHIVNDKLIKIQLGDPVIKNKSIEARYNQLVGMPVIPEDTQRMLRRNFKTAISRYKDNLVKKKHDPLRLDKLPRLRSILNAKAAANATGSAITDPLIAWQSVIYNYAVDDLDTMNTANASRVAGIMGKVKQKAKPVPASAPITEQVASEGQSHTTTDEVVAVRQGEPEANYEPVATIDDVTVDTSDPDDYWSQVATAGANAAKTAYREFDDGKKQSFDDIDDSHNQRPIRDETESGYAVNDDSADADDFDDAGEYDDDTDDDDESEDGMVDISAIESDRQYHKNLFKLGIITEERYLEEMEILDEEERSLRQNDDSDTDMVDVALARTPTYHVLGNLNLNTTKKDPVPENQGDDYPSKEARNLREKADRAVVLDVLRQAENTFNVDI